MAPEEDAKEAKRLRKEAKKQKRLAKEQAAAAAVAEASVPKPHGVSLVANGVNTKPKKSTATALVIADPAADNPSASQEKKQKKLKKRKLPEASKEAAAPDLGDIKKAKKQKKSKDLIQANGVANGVANGGRIVAPQAESLLAKIGNHEGPALRPPLHKALYKEHAETAALSDEAVTAWRNERGIAVEGCSLRPIQEFHQSGLLEELLHATRSFSAPSPIQAQCLPIALAGRDLVGIASTGSGKTLAFGLPCLRHIQAQQQAGLKTGGSPSALVLSPTRELAQQIAAVMEEAGARCGVRTVCVYGGVAKPPQAKALRRGVEVVVATPGRLEDLMNDGACKLDKVSYLVLDEADRMLDLGFEPHIRAIASVTRADRQTLMFSATWPREVQKLAMEYLARPARVVIGSQDLSASHSVTQIVEVIDPAARDKRLIQLLQKYHSSRKNRVLVFVLYKKEAARVEQQLQRAGWKAASIHGDISQAQRSRAVEQFKSGDMPLLIATDVAARGLDIPDVEAVINYSFPLTTEDYVHRIGRTGRAGKTGLAHTFFSGVSDKARSGELIHVLREANQEVPDALLAFGTTTKKKESKLYGAHFKDVDMSVKATKIVFDD